MGMKKGSNAQPKSAKRGDERKIKGVANKSIKLARAVNDTKHQSWKYDWEEEIEDLEDYDGEDW